MWSSTTHITEDARPNIVDALLPLIFRMWLGAWVFLFYTHQQQPWFPSETPGCSGRLWRLWRLWRNLVPSDGELHAACHPGDGSRCIAQHLGAPATNLWASGSTSNHSRAFWEKQHLGKLLVRLELTATTNRATIFKTHVFRLYSHLCIYLSI